MPRQGRRLGPPEVWNLALGSQAKAHAIKATPLSATCPRHLPCSCRTLTPTCPRTFKTAVCPASNPPNASAGLQGNNSYSYYMPLPSVFQGVQDCRLPALKPPKRFQRSRRPPRQQLLQLHAPAICFSGGSRLPFARPQTPQTLPTLPQASKATTLTATLCQLHAPDIYHAPAELLHLHAPGRSRLPFARPQTLQTLPQASKATTLTCPRTFKTAVCPASNPPNASNAPQASKATTLTATTCPCHLFFRGFKTAVCPPSNPPNASNAPAGLQGNNSYSYMPLPSVFQGVQRSAVCSCPQTLTRFQRSRRPSKAAVLQLPALSNYMPHDFYACSCRTLTPTCPRTFKTAVCPASNPPNASAGLQGNNSYSYYMPLPSVFQGVQDCRLPALKPPKRFQRSRRPPRQQLLQLHAPAICFSGGSRLPFARPQTPQTLPTLPQASKATTLTATCPQTLQTLPTLSQASQANCHLFFRGSRLPFARPQTPQTLPTLPQASKATTLTATTCPCHLFFRGFKTAVCPPSNPPNASNAPAGLQGNNSYSYMPLPSVFQGVQDCRLPALKPPKRFQRSRRPPRQQLLQLPSVSYMPQTSTMLLPNSYTYMLQDVQDCRLPGLKPSKRFRRPPRQQLLQLLHAPAICFSGGSRLPFARPQTPQTLPTLPQASKATTLTATCPCHLFFRGFKTAVCPPSNPPNASNAPAGLQGNNSYSYMSPNPPNASNPLAGLPGPAICFSGGSRLPFARPQTPQTLPTLPQASKATTLTATCPQTLQTLPTLSQASKATTLTATCPCHLFFRGFKTAVCPPSNPPNASNALAGLQGNNSYSYMSNAPAGLRGNNSYSYMPLPSVFQGVQDCRLPGPKPPKRFQPSRRPPRQQLLQLHAPAICFSGGSRLPFARPQTPQTLPTLPQASKATTLTATCPCHLFFRGFKTAVCPASNPPNASSPPAGLQGNNSYSYMPLPSVFQGVQDCRLPALKPPKRFQRSRRPPRQQLLQLHVPAICFSGVQDCRRKQRHTQRLPGLKPSKRVRTPPRQQLLQLHAPAICFSGGSRLPFARPQTPQTLPTLPQASKATTLTATCPCHLFFTGFKTAVCPASNVPNASNAPAGLQGNNSYSYPLSATCPRHLPCSCRTLTPTCPRTFKTAVCPASNPPNASAGLQGNNSYSYYMPLPSVFQGVQDCRLPALKPPNASNASAGLQGNNSYSYYMPLPSVFQGFKTAVCPPSNPPNASNAPAGLQGNNSYSYMPLPSVFQGVQDCRLPALKPQTLPTLPQASKATTLTATLCQLHAPDIYHAPAELLHLHAPGRSRLPFARPQTLQTLPQASKATTLTATTCPCHLFFRGFKTAVCPPSNPPNASNAPAGLQGNNSYSYMPLPSVFQGVQDCRLPALKPPKRFQRSRRPPRQQLLQLHVPKPSKRFQPSRRPPRPCHLFFRGSRLPFARPQTPQTLPTLPQASKATTLTATTCPCHLFFRGFKTAVCPPSNPPNASNAPAGLQGNNSYSYMPLPSVFQGVQDCRLPALKPPKRFQRSRRPPRQQLLQLPSVSYMPQTSTMLLPNSYTYMPQDVQDCRLPGLKPSKRFRRPPRQQLLQLLHAPAICFSGGSRLPFARPQTPKRFQRSRRPPRQQLLQLHAPAICFSGGSRLPFARPQTPQTLPTLPEASKATTLTATCPQTLQTLPTLSQASQALPSVFQGFKTAVCPPSNPPNASNAPAGLQGNNSYSYMSSNPDLTDVFFLLGKLCGYCVPTAAWALHVSRALRYHACAFEANDASAADCGLSRQSLATFGTNKA